jgi:acyl carrier protein
MTRQDVHAEIRRLAEGVFQAPVPDDGECRRDQVRAWDSLKHIDLMFTIEDYFSIRFSKEQLSSLDSLTAIGETVQQMLASDHTEASAGRSIGGD